MRRLLALLLAAVAFLLIKLGLGVCALAKWVGPRPAPFGANLARELRPSDYSAYLRASRDTASLRPGGCITSPGARQ